MKDTNSQTEIAQTIGRDKSVISRELSRNCDKRNGCYYFDPARAGENTKIDKKKNQSIADLLRI